MGSTNKEIAMCGLEQRCLALFFGVASTLVHDVESTGNRR